MAYLFFAGKMLSQDADSQVTNALFQVNNANAPVKDGSLVVLGELAEDDTYRAQGDVEYDVYLATAPAAVTDEVVLVDYAGISGGDINENYYKMGVKLFNLEAPEGEIVRVRRLHKHDKFWLGESNFASKPTVGQYAIATAGSCLHTPAASLTAGQYNIKILREQDLTAGMVSKGLMYLCEVVEL